MTRPILAFLTEFTPVSQPEDVDRWDASSAQEAALLEAERIQGLVDAARAEGVAEGRQLAQAEAEARCEQLAHDYTLSLAATRSEWVTAEAAGLADGLRQGLAALETTLADALAEAVTPFIDAYVRNQTIADLRQALADLLAGGHGAMIDVKGPADIVDALRAAWGDHPAVSLTIVEEPELVVAAGDTTIRSQMQAWTDRFQNTFQVPE